MHNWFERTILSNLLTRTNFENVSGPKVQPTPLDEELNPSFSGSGSAQSKSVKGPSDGTSWKRSITRIWSIVVIVGDKPFFFLGVEKRIYVSD